MPRKSDAHKWEATELPPTGDGFAEQYARPAQRCARCGLVRKHQAGDWYYDMPAVSWRMIAEPPCTPERPAKPAERP